MAQNKSYKELMELQGAANGGAGAGGGATSNQMLDLILNRKGYSYDPKTDPAAQAARKTAARNAQAATQNTLGQYAGMTGGMPSTAAVSAAAQAGNQALAQGADRVAELERLAFQNYQTEGQNMANIYGMLQQQEGDAFNRQMQQEQWDYQKTQDEYQRKWNEAQLRAAYGDTSGLEALGVDTSNMAAGGPGYHYTDRSPAPKVEDKPPVGELDAATKNELKFQYGASIPADVWAELAAQYGEAALIAAGFSKKAAAGGGGAGSGGRKPEVGNNRQVLAD